MQYALWIEVHEENLASHRSVIEKRKNILIALSDNYGYFSLILHQHLVTGSVLKVSCSVESETLLTKLSYSVTVNPLVFLALWMNLLPIYDFVTSLIGHLENIASLSYEDLPNVDKLHYTISKKSHLLTSTPVLSEKSLLRQGISQAFDGSFQNSDFCSRFNHCNKYYFISCFPWNEKFSCMIFESVSAICTNLNNHSFPVSFSSKWKWCSRQKQPTHTHTFPWDTGM